MCNLTVASDHYPVKFSVWVVDMSYRVTNIPLPLAAAHFSPTPHLAGSQHPICNNEGNGQLGSFPLTNLVVL